jgi:hypothetical protein
MGVCQGVLRHPGAKVAFSDHSFNSMSDRLD